MLIGEWCNPNCIYVDVAYFALVAGIVVVLAIAATRAR